MQKIAVLGAGNSGLAMCAHLALEGHSVRLWNRMSENIERLRKTKVIHCRGAISGEATLELVTSDLGEALTGVSLILAATPANAHRELASRIAKYLTDQKTIILNPGRTFGVIEVEYTLSEHHAPVMPLVAETQTIVYTCRKSSVDSVDIFSLKKDVLVSARSRSDTTKALEQLPSCLQEHYLLADNLVQTSLGNVGPVLHCLPVILNTGWIENKKVDFKYYYDGITPTIANYLQKLDRERLAIAMRLGVKLESAVEWMQRSYRICGNSLFECIQNNISYKAIDAPRSLQHRYIFEDIPYGLVPFESLGQLVGADMVIIPKVIDFATEFLDFDFRANGRTLQRLGLADSNVDEIIRRLSSGGDCEHA